MLCAPGRARGRGGGQACCRAVGWVGGGGGSDMGGGGGGGDNDMGGGGVVHPQGTFPDVPRSVPPLPMPSSPLICGSLSNQLQSASQPSSAFRPENPPTLQPPPRQAIACGPWGAGVIGTLAKDVLADRTGPQGGGGA